MQSKSLYNSFQQSLLASVLDSAELILLPTHFILLSWQLLNSSQCEGDWMLTWTCGKKSCYVPNRSDDLSTLTKLADIWGGCFSPSPPHPSFRSCTPSPGRDNVNLLMVNAEKHFAFHYFLLGEMSSNFCPALSVITEPSVLWLIKEKTYGNI